MAISKNELQIEDIISTYLKKIDDFKDIDGYFEQISTLLSTHLYVELLFNHLIRKYFILHKKILKDSNRYTFSIKLDFIYEKGFIPEYLYHNINKLNKIRNKLSHNTNFNLLECDLDFKLEEDDGSISNLNLENMIGDICDKSKINFMIIMQIPTLTLYALYGYVKRGMQ